MINRELKHKRGRTEKKIGTTLNEGLSLLQKTRKQETNGLS